LSNWSGKYVIGLTGNIATGKSVVRRMLEHLGAYSIDADALGHRAIAKGAPGYAPVVKAFGRYILDANGEVDRSRLGRIVFSDQQALHDLEAIVHPLVQQAIDYLIKRASQPVVVIEAIKLLEGKLAGACDTIWVTHASQAIQKARLMEKRGMSADEAMQRIQAQAPQELKTQAATVIIQNGGSFEDTWKQVQAAWAVISPQPLDETKPVQTVKVAPGELTIQRGRPRDSADIAALIKRLSRGARSPTQEDIMAAFGEKAFLLLMAGKQFAGMAGWQVENLVARTTDLYLDPGLSVPEALKVLLPELERLSLDLQCEASLVFVPPQFASPEAVWKDLGYATRSVVSLGAQAWQDAARESQPPDTTLFFKQLRVDRVLRPI
jgi:dephospho-CoA kinase